MMDDVFSEWLRRIEAMHPADVELGLERIRQVAARLECSLAPARVITVTGSNGKGSCIAVLESMARQRNISVGAYTSPHLLRFEERLRIDGEPLPAADWCDAFAAVEAARGTVPLTFFEFTTLAALRLLRQNRVQLALLEVGLGGRLDAVNLVDADLAVLCSVDLEHQQWLGADRESIGREKAGVFRSGRIAVCGDRAPPASVLRTAEDTQWFCLGEHFDFASDAQGWSWRGVCKGRRRRLSAMPAPQLAAESAAAAVQAWHCLYPEEVSRDTVAAGLCASLPGRRQRMQRFGRTTLTDVAHNPAAARHLCSFLGEGARYRAVCAMLSDKDAPGFAAELAPAVKAWYVTQPDAPRAMSAARLAEAVRAAGGVCRGVYASVSEALCAAARDAAEDDADEELLVTGSFYAVAEALAERGAAHEASAAHGALRSTMEQGAAYDPCAADGEIRSAMEQGAAHEPSAAHGERRSAVEQGAAREASAADSEIRSAVERGAAHDPCAANSELRSAVEQGAAHEPCAANSELRSVVEQGAAHDPCAANSETRSAVERGAAHEACAADSEIRSAVERGAAHDPCAANSELRSAVEQGAAREAPAAHGDIRSATEPAIPASGLV